MLLVIVACFSPQDLRYDRMLRACSIVAKRMLTEVETLMRRQLALFGMGE